MALFCALDALAAAGFAAAPPGHPLQELELYCGDEDNAATLRVAEEAADAARAALPGLRVSCLEE